MRRVSIRSTVPVPCGAPSVPSWRIPLAQEILAGKFGPGDLIEVGCQDGTLTFEHVIEAELVDP